MNDHNSYLKNSINGGGDPDAAAIAADLEKALKEQGRHIDQLAQPARNIRNNGVTGPTGQQKAMKLKL